MSKLLALDLDGTLLRGDGSITPDDLAAVRRVQAAGIPVTIVTGRLYAGTRATARLLGLTAPVAASDGAELVDPVHDDILDHRGITGEAARLLRGALLDTSGPIEVFPMADGKTVHSSAATPYLPLLWPWSPDYAEVHDPLDHPCWSEDHAGPTIVVAVGHAAPVASAAALARAGDLRVQDFPVPRLRGMPGHDEDPTRLPELRMMLAHARGVDKGRGLGLVCGRMGVALEDTVAVGDWVNDIAFFEAAGRSFAMGDAAPGLIEVATDVLRATRKGGGGVAEAVGVAWPELAARSVLQSPVPSTR